MPYWRESTVVPFRGIVVSGIGRVKKSAPYRCQPPNWPGSPWSICWPPQNRDDSCISRSAPCRCRTPLPAHPALSDPSASVTSPGRISWSYPCGGLQTSLARSDTVLALFPPTQEDNPFTASKYSISKQIHVTNVSLNDCIIDGRTTPFR